ncbi:hypothetical protein ACUH89_03205 [Dermabacteraceae bacterium P13264]
MKLGRFRTFTACALGVAALSLSGCMHKADYSAPAPKPVAPSGENQTIAPIAPAEKGKGGTETAKPKPSEAPKESEKPSQEPAKTDPAVAEPEGEAAGNVIEEPGIWALPDGGEVMQRSEKYLFLPVYAAPGKVSGQQVAESLAEAVDQAQDMTCAAAAPGKVSECTGSDGKWEVTVVPTANGNSALLMRKPGAHSADLAVPEGRYQVAYSGAVGAEGPTETELAATLANGFLQTLKPDGEAPFTPSAKCELDGENSSYAQCEVSGTPDGNGIWYGVIHLDPSGRYLFLLHQNKQA